MHEIPILINIAVALVVAFAGGFFTLGASTVIYPELEGGLQLLSQILVRLGYCEQEILQYTQAVRADHYDLSVSTREEQEALAQLETDRS